MSLCLQISCENGVRSSGVKLYSYKRTIRFAVVIQGVSGYDNVPQFYVNLGRVTGNAKPYSVEFCSESRQHRILAKPGDAIPSDVITVEAVQGISMNKREIPVDLFCVVTLVVSIVFFFNLTTLVVSMR